MLECKRSQILQIFANSRANNSDSSGPIKSVIELIQDLMVTYILTKFGADWLIFVVLECKQSVSAFFPNSGAKFLTPDVLVQFDP